LNPLPVLGREFACPTEPDLIGVARWFAGLLEWGDVCLLEGEMGSGKTFFTTHVYAVMGGDPRQVSSPSYSLVNEYPLTGGLIGGSFFHVDLYRLDGLLEEDDVSQECWMDPHGYSFIEWAGRFPEWKPEKGYHIRLWHLENGRGVRIDRLGKKP